jgi:hypothetical protein
MPDEQELLVPSRPADEFVEVFGEGLFRNDDVNRENPYRPVEEQIPQDVLTEDDAPPSLEDLSMAQLRELPVYQLIEGRSSMDKETLIAAMRAFDPSDPTDDNTDDDENGEGE